jgi:ATP-dependent Lon protease
MAILLDPKKTKPTKVVKVPLVTLKEGVIFPHTDAVLSFGREASLVGVNRAVEGDGLICLVSQKTSKVENPGPKDIYRVGTLCQIEKSMPINDEIHAFVHGVSRVLINDVESQEDGSLTADIIELMEEGDDRDEIKALLNHLVGMVKKSVSLGKTNIEMPAFMRIINSASASVVVDQVASVLQLKNVDKQELLEQTDLKARLKKVVSHLENEIKVLELERKIASKTQKKMDKSMREAILRERLRTIQRELGESDEGDSEILQLKERLLKSGMPKEARKKALKELDRLAKLSMHNPEAGYIRTWLETLAEIPWKKGSNGAVSLAKASRVLSADHYGMKEVKERILEYMAVMLLKAESEQKKKKLKLPGRRRKTTPQATMPTILCFAGPPGVGKTSVGRSIAKALNRKFIRAALGGIRDEAEIRGHRRTYVGAMPGRIIQALIDVDSNNPVVMLDEIDKIGADYRGDPSAALLEVLDPEQNTSFVDHYVDIPFDLSKVLFITTANVLDTIPPALRDRLEVINFSGYTQDDKKQIALKHLLEKQRENNALGEKDVVIAEPAIEKIIKFYTRESGVRHLEREISKVYRKVAKKIASKSRLKRPYIIDDSNLARLLGPRRYNFGLAEDKDAVGIVTGLAYTSYGGDILLIEVALMVGRGRIVLTGQLGDVMKESAQAALSYVRSKAKKLGIDPAVFAKTDIHIHVPEGAVPKDGPSAGAAMTTALVSAFTKRKINRLMGMTGEVTLRGRVTEIGGVKEKSIAGHRSGLKELILPKDNRKDMVEIPTNVKKDIKFHFVSNMDQVLRLALDKKE